MNLKLYTIGFHYKAKNHMDVFEQFVLQKTKIENNGNTKN